LEGTLTYFKVKTCQEDACANGNDPIDSAGAFQASIRWNTETVKPLVLNSYEWSPKGTSILSDLELKLTTISPIIDNSVITITFNSLAPSDSATCEVLYFSKCVLNKAAKSIALTLTTGSAWLSSSFNVTIKNTEIATVDDKYSLQWQTNGNSVSVYTGSSIGDILAPTGSVT